MNRLDQVLRGLRPSLSGKLIASLERVSRLPEVDLADVRSLEMSGCEAFEIQVGDVLEFPAVDGIVEPATHVFPPFAVYRVPEGTLDSPSGLVFTDGQVVSQSGLGYRSAQDAAFITGASLRYARSDGSRSSLPHLASLGRTDNYYHFMIEALPRILAIQSIQPSVTFIAGGGVPSFAQAALEACGINWEEFSPSRSVYRASHIWTATPPELWWPSLGAVRLIRNAFPSKTQVSLREECVYVSRQGAARSPANESELEFGLRDLGFDVVQLEDLTLQEQVSMLSTASVVIGMHGAGLTNIAFMNEDQSVLEIAYEDYWYPCFMRLATVRNLNYELILQQGAPGSPLESPVIDRVLSQADMLVRERRG